MKLPQLVRYPICILSAPILLSAPAFAQAPESDDVYDLSPFVVNATDDRGYRATNAISGTSLNTAIRDLPMPLEVVNRELIDDLHATNMQESLSYSAGVYTQSFENTATSQGRIADSSPSSTNLNSPFTNTISLRGYTVPSSQRFGFRVGAQVPAYGVLLGGSTDTVTAERLEVVRGPQALLYGINVLSGVVNILPKEPLFARHTEIGFGVGSYDYYRGTLDHTDTLISDKLAYRVMGAWTDEGHWSDFQETERRDYALQLKWRMNPRYELLVEGKYSTFQRSGIGARYFVDNDQQGGPSSWRWENAYGERITFGRDPVDVPIYHSTGDEYDSPFVRRQDFDYPDTFYDFGPDFRISGPDTFFERRERTLMGILRANFTDNLSGQFGAYFVRQDEEEFNVNLRTFTHIRGAVPTAPPRPGFGGGEPNWDRPTTITNAMRNWYNNPEVGLNGARTPQNTWNDPDFLVSLGVGDPFVFPRLVPAAGSGYPAQLPNVVVQDRDNPDNYSRRYARYVWYNKPLDAESLQLNARLVYTFDTEHFQSRASHTFSTGANYIKDRVNFITANVDANNDNYVYSGYSSDPSIGRQAEDPYYFRQSVFDFTPMRYNGENLAILANPSFNRLTALDGYDADGNPIYRGFRSGSETGSGGDTLARSGHKQAHLWYRGFYGLYHGKFFNDRLHLIGGVRQDQYQVKESEQLVIIDQLRASNVWQGSIDPVTPWFVGDGTGPYQSPAGIPQSLDERVRADYQRLQGGTPNGTVEYNFPGYQKFNTKTFGLSYRINDPLSVYYLYSEGVFPNTGQRDGNYDPIGAEQTTNNEIGFKFDFFDGRLSGTISLYRIERENAVFFWPYAPAPAKWHGGINEPVNREANRFSPDAARGAGSAYKLGQHLPVTYAVAKDYIAMAAEEMGIENFDSLNLANYGAVLETPRGGHEPMVPQLGRAFVFVRSDTLENDPNAELLSRAFEIALRTDDPLTLPLFYNGFNDTINNNPSNNDGLGANVTFEEVGKGIDGQLIFAPTPNYQIVFSYSYQNREVRAIHLVDAVDQQTGENFGTRYDAWVLLLGVDNFDDPTRASTFNGGSLKGLDLSFVPRSSASLWNKYRFSEGPLTGLEIGGGVKYTGSAPTSVDVGGRTMGANQFRTPDTKERFVFDAFTAYRFDLFNMRWRASLNVRNVFNHTEDTLYAHYQNDFGGEEVRRTRVYYSPRTWRLSLSAEF